MRLIKSMLQWVISAFLIYSCLSFAGATINYVGQKTLVDSDGAEAIANIVTSTQGLFTGLLGYGDFFEYSGFHIVPFILGAICWALTAIFLCYITRNKDCKKDKFIYSGTTLVLLGSLLLLMSFIATVIYTLFTHDEFAPLLFVFLAVIFIPVFMVGLALLVFSKFLH